MKISFHLDSWTADTCNTIIDWSADEKAFTATAAEIKNSPVVLTKYGPDIGWVYSTKNHWYFSYFSTVVLIRSASHLRGTSNEYPQNMFSWRNKKNIIWNLHNPSCLELCMKWLLNPESAGKICSRRHLILFFLIFQRKQVLIFHVNHLLGRRFTWNIKTCFLWKIKKNISKCRLL